MASEYRQTVTTSLLNMRALGAKGILTVDNAKSLLFFYVVFKYSLKSLRHVSARGLITTAKESYQSVAQVRRDFPHRPHLVTHMTLSHPAASPSSVPAPPSYSPSGGFGDGQGLCRY